MVSASDVLKTENLPEESAHSPMIEETELFNNTVINFINEYR